MKKEVSTKKLVETIVEGIQNRKGQRIVTVDLRKLKDVIKRVGLDPDDKKKYKKYSLGMKQKLGIACAIMAVKRDI